MEGAALYRGPGSCSSSSRRYALCLGCGGRLAEHSLTAALALGGVVAVLAVLLEAQRMFRLRSGKAFLLTLNARAQGLMEGCNGVGIGVTELHLPLTPLSLYLEPGRWLLWLRGETSLLSR